MKIIIRPFSSAIPTKFVPFQFSRFNAIFRVSCCWASKKKLCFTETAFWSSLSDQQQKLLDSEDFIGQAGGMKLDVNELKRK